jgi:branched-chain amino acid transport system substrate-binding protein
VRSTRLGNIAAASAAVVLFAAGCGGGDGDGDGTAASPTAGGDGGAACDQAIAFFGALTGDAANLGIAIRDGAKFAVDQYSAEAECPVELVEFDSQGSPDQAPALAQEAISNEAIIGIVGPAFSGESEAANPLFDEAGLPIITASASDPGLAEAGLTIFHRMIANDGVQGPAIATYIGDIAQSQAVFVVDDQSAYGLGLADIVRETLGDAVVGSDSIQVGQTDFSATVTAIRSSGADTVFFGGYYTEAGLLVAQMRDAGITATFVSGDGSKDPGFIDAAGAEAAEGAILTCACFPPEKASGTFYTDFENEHGSPPGTYGAEAYDAANVFLQGIAEGNATREDMLAWVNGYDAQGVTKDIKFQENGEIEALSVWAYKVTNGELLGDQEIPVE